MGAPNRGGGVGNFPPQVDVPGAPAKPRLANTFPKAPCAVQGYAGERVGVDQTSGQER